MNDTKLQINSNSSFVSCSSSRKVTNSKQVETTIMHLTVIIVTMATAKDLMITGKKQRSDGQQKFEQKHNIADQATAHIATLQVRNYWCSCWTNICRLISLNSAMLQAIKISLFKASDEKPYKSGMGTYWLSQVIWNITDYPQFIISAAWPH